jgi:predicted RNA-binding Zn ribbon-like protein
MADATDPLPGWTAPRFLGGRICLDFANTLDRRLAPGAPAEESEDKLAGGYPALLAWALARGLVGEGAAEALQRRAAAGPEAAASAHAAALALRGALLHLFDAFAEGREPPEPALGRIVEAPAPTPLHPVPGGYRHHLPGRVLEEPLWPVAWSAASLLAEGEGALVGRCQAPGCGWVFLDVSRNRSRLWCSAEGCGNRVRARRHAAARRARS